MYLNVVKANVEKLVAILDEVSEITQGLVDDSHSSLNRSISMTEAVSIVTVLLILLMNVLLVMLVLKRILAPIQEITESSRQLSEGKLDFEIDVRSQDELGQLAGSLNTSDKDSETRKKGKVVCQVWSGRDFYHTYAFDLYPKI